MAAYQRAYNARRKAADPDYHHKQNYAYRIKHPERYLYHTAKARAKAIGMDFNIEVTDIVIPDVCPVLGIPLFVQAGKGKKPNSPSLDRIDSSKGYVKGNVQVMSWRANDLKADGTIEEFTKLLEFLNA